VQAEVCFLLAWNDFVEVKPSHDLAVTRVYMQKLYCRNQKAAH